MDEKDAKSRLIEGARFVSRRVRERAREVDWSNINSFGYDDFGFHPPTAMIGASMAELLYRKYFRVEVEGIDNVPDSGRVLLYANHSGQLPLDGAMIASALLIEKSPPRVVRALIEY